MQTMHVLIVLISGLGASWCYAQSSGAKGDKVVIGTSMLLLSEEESQGGEELPGGMATFTALNLQFNKTNYFSGIGLFYHLDSVGDSQKSSALGAKVEFFVPSHPYYVEYGYGFMASEEYTNRAAQNREGAMSYFGLGLRFTLATWLFFDGSLKHRTWIFTKEDGLSLPEKITKTQLIPFVGLGVQIAVN